MEPNYAWLSIVFIWLWVFPYVLWRRILHSLPANQLGRILKLKLVLELIYEQVTKKYFNQYPLHIPSYFRIKLFVMAINRFF